jgi:CRP-like cAMP-binding protein
LSNILIRKLEAFAPLPKADRQLLDKVVQTVHEVAARQDIVKEGDVSTHVQLILEGFACRYKLLPDGKRHIVAYLVPGDFCDLHVFILKAMDHTIATLSPCKVVHIPRHQILELTERPAIARALWWAALVDEATLREWLVNVGAREAEPRVAHLLCELLLRLRAVGLADGGSYELPITQTELADTVGLSDVHVSRVLQRLRAKNLITWSRKKLVIVDVVALNAFSGFDPNYLHLNGRKGVKEGST